MTELAIQLSGFGQAAWVQVGQVQSAQVQLLQASVQDAHSHCAWLLGAVWERSAPTAPRGDDRPLAG